jgi:hypothetical protein
MIKSLKTIGLIVLILVGLLGVLLKMNNWPFSELFLVVGFFGFPAFYGYITWPVDQKIPDATWFGTIAAMLLFALMILNKF